MVSRIAVCGSKAKPPGQRLIAFVKSNGGLNEVLDCSLEQRDRPLSKWARLSGIGMLISAEIRWFWRGRCPQPVHDWFFKSGLPPGGGSSRVDRYAGQRREAEISLKRRGNKPELEMCGDKRARRYHVMTGTSLPSCPGSSRSRSITPFEQNHGSERLNEPNFYQSKWHPGKIDVASRVEGMWR